MIVGSICQISFNDLIEMVHSTIVHREITVMGC